MNIKRTIIRTTLIFFLLTGLVACTTLPPPAAFELKPKSRVGVVSALSEKIGHAHYVGLDKKIDIAPEQLDWKLNEFFKAEFRRILTENDYEYIPVDPEEVANAGMRYESLFEVVDNQWVLLEDASPSIKYLRDDLGLDVILSFKPSVYKVRYSCSPGGCLEYVIDRPGYYSKTSLLSFFAVEASFAVLPFRKSVIVLNPPTPIAEVEVVGASDSLFGSLSRPRNPHQKSLKSFKPKNIKSITDEEWVKIETTLKLLITENIEKEVEKLKMGSSGTSK